MELRHLRYFLAIARTGNIREASRIVHITQPALSRQLQDLEETLGVTLFERLPRGLQLTAAGKAYQEDITRLMQTLEAAGQRARRVAAGELGLLRISYLEVAAWHGAVPGCLQAFSSHYPDVQLELTPANTARQYQLLEQHLVDGCFVYPFDDIPSYCTSVAVQHNNVVLAIPQAWADQPALPLSLAAIQGKPFISFYRDEHPRYYDYLFSSLAMAGMVPSPIQSARDEGGILSLVAAGIGVAIVNDANLHRPPAGIRLLPFTDFSLPLTLHFAYRTEHNNPTLAAFLQLITPA